MGLGIEPPLPSKAVQIFDTFDKKNCERTTSKAIKLENLNKKVTVIFFFKVNKITTRLLNS